jgi:hypothetical protein
MAKPHAPWQQQQQQQQQPQRQRRGEGSSSTSGPAPGGGGGGGGGMVCGVHAEYKADVRQASDALLEWQPVRSGQATGVPPEVLAAIAADAASEEDEAQGSAADAGGTAAAAAAAGAAVAQEPWTLEEQKEVLHAAGVHAAAGRAAQALGCLAPLLRAPLRNRISGARQQRKEAAGKKRWAKAKGMRSFLGASLGKMTAKLKGGSTAHDHTTGLLEGGESEHAVLHGVSVRAAVAEAGAAAPPPRGAGEARHSSDDDDDASSHFHLDAEAWVLAARCSWLLYLRHLTPRLLRQARLCFDAALSDPTVARTRPELLLEGAAASEAAGHVGEALTRLRSIIERHGYWEGLPSAVFRAAALLRCRDSGGEAAAAAAVAAVVVKAGPSSTAESGGGGGGGAFDPKQSVAYLQWIVELWQEQQNEKVERQHRLLRTGEAGAALKQTGVGSPDAAREPEAAVLAAMATRPGAAGANSWPQLPWHEAELTFHLAAALELAGERKLAGEGFRRFHDLMLPAERAGESAWHRNIRAAPSWGDRYSSATTWQGMAQRCAECGYHGLAAAYYEQALGRLPSAARDARDAHLIWLRLAEACARCNEHERAGLAWEHFMALGQRPAGEGEVAGQGGGGSSGRHAAKTTAADERLLGLTEVHGNDFQGEQYAVMVRQRLALIHLKQWCSFGVQMSEEQLALLRTSHAERLAAAAAAARSAAEVAANRAAAMQQAAASEVRRERILETASAAVQKRVNFAPSPSPVDGEVDMAAVALTSAVQVAQTDSHGESGGAKDDLDEGAAAAVKELLGVSPVEQLAAGAAGEVASVLAEQHLRDKGELQRVHAAAAAAKETSLAQAEVLRVKRMQALQEAAKVRELQTENRKLKQAVSGDELAQNADMIAELQAENEELLAELAHLKGGGGAAGGLGQQREEQRLQQEAAEADAKQQHEAEKRTAKNGGWELVDDGTGTPYYWHRLTGETQYEKPAGFGGSAAAAGDWQLVADDGNGHPYYWCEWPRALRAPRWRPHTDHLPPINAPPLSLAPSATSRRAGTLSRARRSMMRPRALGAAVPPR